MFPLKDDVRTRSFPIFTILIILINIGVFIYQFGLENKELQRFFYIFGATPYNIMNLYSIPDYTGIPVVLTIFTAMFIHGGIFHLGGNMLYLWIFGNNVEDSVGHFKFFFFYILCGVIAAFTQIILERNSKVPMIGASGAVSGILGAYILLYPKARILTLVPIIFFFKLMEIPALLFLGIWIIFQFIYGELSQKASVGGGTAWFAHIGGFFAGCTLIYSFKKKKVKFFN